MKHVSFATLKSLTLIVMLLALGSCGGTGYDGTACISNFVQGNVGMKVTYVLNSSNRFSFKVCYNDSFQGSKVSVYGVETFADIATISAADARLSHMTDGLYPGDEFEVTFNNDDTYFAIYEDVSGNHSTTTQIIKGEFR